MVLLLLSLACSRGDPRETPDLPGDSASDTDSETDSGDPFADAVADFQPGPGAGYGQDRLPDVVLGPPMGGGAKAGSTDVLSLGCEGSIVLGFDDLVATDGDGPDLLVFENPFSTWFETGVVAASEDALDWHEWPCEPEAEGAPGCAGMGYVYASADNDIDPTDPEVAGGDAFDLADVGLASAAWVRVRDSGANDCAGTSGGFDLDALAVVNGVPATATGG